MALCITTAFVLPTRLETHLFQIRQAAPPRWQNQPQLMRQQCRQVASILPGLIIQSLRQVTRLNARKRRLALIGRSTRWVQTCKATEIRMDLILTQGITTESELPMGRLIPTIRMNRLL